MSEHEEKRPDPAYHKVDWNKIKVFCLLFLAFSVLMVFFRVTREVLVPFVVAVFLYYAVAPLVNWFQRSLRIPRFLSLILTLLVALLVASSVVLLAVSSFSSVLRSFDQYRQKIIEFTRSMTDWVNAYASIIGVRIDDTDLVDYIRRVPVLSWASRVSSGVFGFFGKTILTVLFFIFLIAGTKLKRRPSNHPESIAYQINEKISRYLATKFFVSLGTGLMTTFLLWIFGLEMAFMFGLFAFLLNFIPNFGSIIAVLLPLPVALMQFGPGLRLLLVLVVPGAMQFAVGNLMEPRIMGDSLGLHPVVILLSLLLWGFLWGAPGMFLAVPIMAVVRIILGRYELTHRFADALSGEIYR